MSIELKKWERYGIYMGEVQYLIRLFDTVDVEQSHMDEIDIHGKKFKIKYLGSEDLSNMDVSFLKDCGFEGIPCECIGRGVYGCTDCMDTGWEVPADRIVLEELFVDMSDPRFVFDPKVSIFEIVE